jgi:dihydrofolate reductase
MSVIVSAFTTLDGVVSDPDGSAGTPEGGWLFRFGRGEIDGDRFGLGSTLEKGVLLMGRGTWQQFANLWPHREGPFAAQMNAVPKLVASRTLTDTSAWANSRLLDGDLVDAVKGEERDIVIMGSLGIVHQLMAEDLVDEYWLMTFPTVLGAGRRIFPADGPHANLECVSAEQVGALVLTRYRRAAAH